MHHVHAHLYQTLFPDMAWWQLAGSPQSSAGLHARQFPQPRHLLPSIPCLGRILIRSVQLICSNRHLKHISSQCDRISGVHSTNFCTCMGIYTCVDHWCDIQSLPSHQAHSLCSKIVQIEESRLSFSLSFSSSAVQTFFPSLGGSTLNCTH